jgi:hypothetical protein
MAFPLFSLVPDAALRHQLTDNRSPTQRERTPFMLVMLPYYLVEDQIS